MCVRPCLWINPLPRVCVYASIDSDLFWQRSCRNKAQQTHKQHVRWESAVAASQPRHADTHMRPAMHRRSVHTCSSPHPLIPRCFYGVLMHIWCVGSYIFCVFGVAFRANGRVNYEWLYILASFIFQFLFCETWIVESSGFLILPITALGACRTSACPLLPRLNYLKRDTEVNLLTVCALVGQMQPRCPGLCRREEGRDGRGRKAARGLNVRCGCRGRGSGRDLLDNVDDVEMSRMCRGEFWKVVQTVQ